MMIDTLADITNELTKEISSYNSVIKSGKLSQMIGLVLESDGPNVPVGEICHLKDENGQVVSKSEVVGFKEGNKILSMVYGDTSNLYPGMEIVATGEKLSINVGRELLGRIVDGLGNPIDGKGPIVTSERRSIYAAAPNPLLRKRIEEPISTGVKSIDGMLTIGKGQRMGIFAGSGVGKSTLIGMISRNTNADINVIALIGERGREVREFIEKDLGEEGLQRSVIVVSASDDPPLTRVKSAFTATTLAEYFREDGFDVMLMMDSSTRFAMAQREVGLSIGEPPTSKGYTPSVFSGLQQLMERSGTSENGSITGLYTVLVEGDDMNEPVSDTVRGILDGHILLSRDLAAKGHYPAIEILGSVSRVMRDVISKEHSEAAYRLQNLIAAYRNSEDLINVGAYKPGSNEETDKAIEKISAINDFLTQSTNELVSLEETAQRLIDLV
ncbi:MAG: FliI/YscN family ATPase [Chlorobiota bacterium]